MLRQAVRLNSLSELALTKLDVLDTLDTVKVCVAYDVDGERVTHLPYHQSVLHKATPVYEELPGWKTDLVGADRARPAPEGGRSTTSPSSGEQVGVPISLVGVGPGREQFLHFDA